jgi:hypothetical protein
MMQWITGVGDLTTCAGNACISAMEAPTLKGPLAALVLLHTRSISFRWTVESSRHAMTGQSSKAVFEKNFESLLSLTSATTRCA